MIGKAKWHHCECPPETPSIMESQDMTRQMKRPDNQLVVTLNSGLDTHNIEFIQLLEKRLDAALKPLGLIRSNSFKSGSEVKFTYWQGAVVLDRL